MSALFEAFPLILPESKPILHQTPAPKPTIPCASPSDSDVSESEAALSPSPSLSEVDSLSASELENICLSAIVYLASPAPEPEVLSSLFDKYAERNSMSLCIATLGSSSQDEEAFIFTSSVLTSLGMSPGRWSKESVQADKPTPYFICRPSKDEVVYDSKLANLNTPAVPQVSARHEIALSLAHLRSILTIPSSSGHHIFYTVERPAVVFAPRSRSLSLCPPGFPSVGKGNVPILDEWKTLWSAWDLVTLKMIPQEMLHQKPIDLRHKCLFYIGHIPTFLDMLLSKAIGGSPTEPKNFWNIFERGIDPHVDDPDHCHRHSEVPKKDEDWPTLDSILSFRNGVRARLTNLYEELQSGQRKLTRNIARTLVMTLEHEGFHVETLLYMLIQRAGAGTLPPPGFTVPPWTLLASQWDSIPPPSTAAVTLGPATVLLGHHDSEADDFVQGKESEVGGHEFGWDNESPPRCVQVGKFRAEWRPVSNGEFEEFWRASRGKVEMPKSWVEEGGEIKVRTMYGPVLMDVARYWPVLTSYDDLAEYARCKGGRLPTEPELRLFLDTYDVGHEGGGNIGFRHWHPVPATAGIDEYGGKGSNGGVWEWTSTLFDTHDGLVPTNLFVGYSTDFFDTKHQVVLGASYATIPRLATRRTVRNFYQHNYPYPWVGARVVYDL